MMYERNSSTKNENSVIVYSSDANKSRVKFLSPKNISGASQQIKFTTFC